MTHLRPGISLFAAVVLLALSSFGLPITKGAVIGPLTLDVWPSQAPGEKQASC